MAPEPAARWWASKLRRVVRYVRGSVSQDERAALARWVPPAMLEVFDAMHPADQRHGLDVVDRLRSAGHGDDPELLLAGLLHDAGKGRNVRLWHRVAWSLGRRYGRRVTAPVRHLPGARAMLDRLDRHAELSAGLARLAGASDRTVALIEGSVDPADPAARALRGADDGEPP